jgi:hypothetical protein
MKKLEVIADDKRAISSGITLPVHQVSYPYLFHARKSDDNANAKAKYSLTIMFDKQNKAHLEALSVIKAGLTDVLAAKWPDSKTRPRTPLVGATMSPIKDGDSTTNKMGIPLNETNPEYAGHYLIRASSTRRPAVVEKEGNGYVPVTDEESIYGGCFGQANIHIYTYSVKNSSGVTFSLNGFMKTGDGEAFGGGTHSAESMFGAPSEGEDNSPFVNQSQQEDDDIPF